MKDINGDPIVFKNYLGEEVDFQTKPTSDPETGLVDSQTPSDAVPVGLESFAGSLSFSDEFRALSLNTNKWLPWYPDVDFWNTTQPGGHKTNTDEPQAYDPSAISFNGETMTFTFSETETVAGLSYTSGMVCSQPSLNQTHGYFEARLMLPNANDAWPAFWLFPSNHVWPFEIDIMENDGKTDFNLQTYHTFHYPRPTPGGNDSEVYHHAEAVGGRWIVFGALWEPDRIRWYVDGDLAYDLAIQPEYADRDAYIILNLAGKQSSSPASGFTMGVDYVRVWELPA